jgi:phosphoribosyl-ATP pyrophosphohydrolase/phosphoribosyl-AMP cyclohydrolase
MNLYTENVKLSFEKYSDGLMPAIIQDSRRSKVLMLGFMNAEALEKTRSSGWVTFFSRSKSRLWTKGETSGNFLSVAEISVDCDGDTLLIRAAPSGPVCHTGSDTCFGEKNENGDFLFELEKVIRERKNNAAINSYTSKLFGKGLDKIAQKVGEEAVELVIEAKNSNNNAFKAEAADLLFHLLVLLAEKDTNLHSVIDVLRLRSK